MPETPVVNGQDVGIRLGGEDVVSGRTPALGYVASVAVDFFAVELLERWDELLRQRKLMSGGHTSHNNPRIWLGQVAERTCAGEVFNGSTRAFFGENGFLVSGVDIQRQYMPGIQRLPIWRLQVERCDLPPGESKRLPCIQVIAEEEGVELVGVEGESLEGRRQEETEEDGVQANSHCRGLTQAGEERSRGGHVGLSGKETKSHVTSWFGL
jgi:hypothetical protein